MSLNIDMKMILSLKSAGSHCNSPILSWISLRIAAVLNPGRIFHSNSIGFRFSSLKKLVSEYHLILFSQDWSGSSPILSRHNTESEKTYPLANAYWWARLCNTLVDIHLKSWESIRFIQVVSVWPLINFSISPKSCPVVLREEFCTCLKFTSCSFPRWIADLRGAFINIPPYSHLHIQIFHRIACWSWVDFSDHVVNVIHVRHVIWRHGKEVFHGRSFITLTFLKFWRYEFCWSSCKWFPTTFVSLSNRLRIPWFTFRIVSFTSIYFSLMRQVSPLLLLQPAKVCIH